MNEDDRWYITDFLDPQRRADPLQLGELLSRFDADLGPEALFGCPVPALVQAVSL